MAILVRMVLVAAIAAVMGWVMYIAIPIVAPRAGVSLPATVGLVLVL